MDAKVLARIGWLLALLPLWGPIVAVCIVVLAACVWTSPWLGLVIGLLALNYLRATWRERRL